MTVWIAAAAQFTVCISGLLLRNVLHAGMEGELHMEGNVKTTRWKLTWLPSIPDLVPLQLVDFDHLITKKKPEEGDAIADLVNPRSVRGIICSPGLLVIAG